MRNSYLAGLLFASTALAQLEVSIGKKDKHSNGKSRDIARGFVKKQDVEKRQDGSLEMTAFPIYVYSAGGAYFGNLTVGTPPQLQTVLIDTGSSDLYFDASTSQACESTGAHSCVGGEYDQRKSSTYEQVAAYPAFNNTYGDGSTARGPFGTDVVCLADQCISNVQFGLAQDVVSTTGHAFSLMGVGYSIRAINEVTGKPYQNIPDVLAATGIINSRLYSLYLDDTADSGSILFGALDTAKYTGSLQTFPILTDEYDIIQQGGQSYGIAAQFVTSITDLSTNVNGKTSSIWSGGSPGLGAYQSNQAAIPVLLDSGTSFFHVPPQYYKGIFNAFSDYVARDGTVYCSDRDRGDSITIIVGGLKQIEISSREFILPLYDPATREPQKANNGDDLCIFAITPDEDSGGFWIAGDSVMRSMYIVYDLDNAQLSIAQAKLNTTSSSVKVVQAGRDGVQKAAGGSYQPPQSASASFLIPPSASNTGQSYAVSTAQTTVGVATGAAAVPADAQPSGDGSSGGSGSGGGSSAGVKVAPAMGWYGVCSAGVVVAAAVFGAALVL